MLLFFFFYKFSDCFSDAGYIKFRITVNRLGVFIEDPMTSDFIERFVS